jgi:hypothetical protein
VDLSGHTKTPRFIPEFHEIVPAIQSVFLCLHDGQRPTHLRNDDPAIPLNGKKNLLHATT